MSVNLNTWLNQATVRLNTAGISSARLDVEIILAHTIKQSRTYMHAHDDEPLDDRLKEIADTRLGLRIDRTPIAYIVGHKDFYGHQFKVNTATLIPRPESETIIDSVIKIALEDDKLPENLRIVDVGTGSGCLGITLKLELPKAKVTLLDISQQALTVASANAKPLNANINMLKSDLLSEYFPRPDVIVANLPYVDKAWEVSPELEFEPASALFASDGGLSLIYKLIKQASKLMSTSKYLVLEADPSQHDDIKSCAQENHFNHLFTSGYCLVFQKN